MRSDQQVAEVLKLYLPKDYFLPFSKFWWGRMKFIRTSDFLWLRNLSLISRQLNFQITELGIIFLFCNTWYIQPQRDKRANRTHLLLNSTWPAVMIVTARYYELRARYKIDVVQLFLICCFCNMEHWIVWVLVVKSTQIFPRSFNSFSAHIAVIKSDKKWCLKN